jgi:hypothetical protein
MRTVIEKDAGLQKLMRYIRTLEARNKAKKEETKDEL